MMEEPLGEIIKVLDHGFVRLVDHMGGDDRIVQSARVSYGTGTKTKREDEGLINYLMKHRHTSPFEQVVLVYHCKMPIFVARQWVRHRTARLNEISGRYSELPAEFYIPDPEQVRFQSKVNKQGRSEAFEPDAAKQIRGRMLAVGEIAFDTYKEWLEQDLARETARINLPLSTYTEWYWQIDLHNLFHFLKLRLDPHAQWETRQYAQALAHFAKQVAPVAYDAWEEHVLYAVTFSRTAAKRLRDLIPDDFHPPELALEMKDTEGV